MKGKLKKDLTVSSEYNMKSIGFGAYESPKYTTSSLNSSSK